MEYKALIKKQEEEKESKDAKQKKAVSTVQPGQMTLTNIFSKNIENKTYGSQRSLEN